MARRERSDEETALPDQKSRSFAEPVLSRPRATRTEEGRSFATLRMTAPERRAQDDIRGSALRWGRHGDGSRGFCLLWRLLVGFDLDVDVHFVGEHESPRLERPIPDNSEVLPVEREIDFETRLFGHAAPAFDLQEPPVLDGNSNRSRHAVHR